MIQFVSSDSYPALCDHRYFADGQPAPDMRFRGGEVVFCKTDEIWKFFEKLRLTRRMIILVTGQSDHPCDAQRQAFLPPQVAHWFAVNVTNPHPLVTALPLGIGPATDSITATGEALTAAMRPPAAREQWLYVNFRPETNPGVREPVFTWFRNLAGEPWVTFRDPAPKGQAGAYLEELGNHRFVLCPRGNGADTHRLWEAMATGAVPVVEKSAAMEPFRHLPLLFVDDLRAVTLDTLKAAWPHFAGERSLPPEILASHWADEIAAARMAIAARPQLNWRRFIFASSRYGAGMMARRLGIQTNAACL